MKTNTIYYIMTMYLKNHIFKYNKLTASTAVWSIEVIFENIFLLRLISKGYICCKNMHLWCSINIKTKQNKNINPLISIYSTPSL